MKYFLTALYLPLCIASLIAQSSNYNLHTHLSNKELFKQEILDKENLSGQEKILENELLKSQ